LTYPGTTAVNYAYDNDSRLTQVTDPTGTYQFTFDNLGRLKGTTTQHASLTSRTFTTSYSRDSADAASNGRSVPARVIVQKAMTQESPPLLASLLSSLTF
jgi:YD repeat-containing protein